jgi:serine/threonine protein kinase
LAPAEEPADISATRLDRSPIRPTEPHEAAIAKEALTNSGAADAEGALGPTGPFQPTLAAQPSTADSNLIADGSADTLVADEGRSDPAVAATMPVTKVDASASAPLPTASDSAEHDPILGQEIAGRFRVEKRLGAGGMGTVYLAEQTAVSRAVVLKFLHPSLTKDADFAERFEREALAISHLTSPNTIVLFDFGTAEDGRLYMAMEYLEGRTLSQVVRSSGALPPLRAIAITLQILSSLHEAHEKGIVHRDLKPENIMLVARSGTPDFVKVLDFGIAKILGEDEAPIARADQRTTKRPRLDVTTGALAALKSSDSRLTQQGAIFGSPRYMAPEQALGESISPRTDIYAVGVILYEMLCGRPPFAAENTMRLLHDQVHAPVPDPRRRNPDIDLPQELTALVLRCLSKEPGERPESTEALTDELRAMIVLITRKQEAEERALLDLVGIRKRVPKAPLVAGGVALIAVIISVVFFAMGRSTSHGGKPLGPNDRVFVSVSKRPLPAWIARPFAAKRGQGIARGVLSPKHAMALAEAAAVVSLLDLPMRFEKSELERRRMDLSKVAEIYASAKRRLKVVDKLWVKLAQHDENQQKPRYQFDGYARLEAPDADLRAELYRHFADLRYKNASFLLDRAARKRHCQRAHTLADEVRAAIKDLELPKPRKQSMLGYLEHQISGCAKPYN